MEKIVVCKNITKVFGFGPTQVNALQGLGIEINRGELRLLMGPSGSGKTTLLSVIAGIMTPTSGTCIVLDTDIEKLTDVERTLFRAKNIGFVFQSFNLIPTLTCEENISIPLVLRGMKNQDAIEKSKEMMKELGLPDKIGVFPTLLSGGQQQRIAIGRALIHEPSLIVCDEPTSFLDHDTGQKIMTLLRSRLKKSGNTIIVVSHDPRIIPFADKINRLEDGRIIKSKARTAAMAK
jgi:putative ABC transport system ATP-binding protein